MILVIAGVAIVLLVIGYLEDVHTFSDVGMVLEAVGGGFLLISLCVSFVLGLLILEEPRVENKLALHQEILDDPKETNENKGYSKVLVNGYKEDLIDIETYKEWLYFGGGDYDK